MFATKDASAEKEALPVKEDPLANCGDGVLRLIERRKLRLQAVFCKGHAEVSRVDNNHY
jgi:hypothetical protein